MAVLINSEGTRVFVSETLPTANVTTGEVGATEYAAIGAIGDAAWLEVELLADLPTPESTTPVTRTPVLDAIGEVVGAGSTTNANQAFSIYTEKPRKPGYALIRKQNKAKAPLSVINMLTDGTLKYYQARVPIATEATPIGNSLQMAVELAVITPVIEVLGA